MTIWFAGAIAAVMLVGGVFLSASAITYSRAQLQVVADMAALGAADATPISSFLSDDQVSGCDVALAIAAANAVELGDCWHEGFDTYVEVHRSTSSWVAPIRLGAKARAGPQYLLPLRALQGPG